jgi:hypothetical protein
MIHGFFTGLCVAAVLMFRDTSPVFCLWCAFLGGMNFVCALRRNPNDIPDWVRKEMYGE